MRFIRCLLTTAAFVSFVSIFWCTASSAQSIKSVGLCNEGSETIKLASLLVSDGFLKNRAEVIAFEEMKPGECWSLNRTGSGFNYQMYEAVAVAVFQRDARGVLGNPRYGFSGYSNLGRYKWGPKTLCLEPDKQVSEKGSVSSILSRFTGSCSGTKIPAQVSFAVKPRDQRVRLTIAPQKQDILRPWQASQPAPTPVPLSKEQVRERHEKALSDVWSSSQKGYRRKNPILNPHSLSLEAQAHDHLIDVDRAHFENKGFYIHYCIANAQATRDVLNQLEEWEDVVVRRGYRDAIELIETSVLIEHLAYAEWRRQLETLAANDREIAQWTHMLLDTLNARIGQETSRFGSVIARGVLDYTKDKSAADVLRSNSWGSLNNFTGRNDLCRRNLGGLIKTAQFYADQAAVDAMNNHVQEELNRHAQADPIPFVLVAPELIKRANRN